MARMTAAHFVLCKKCSPFHGTIVCADGTRASCFSKVAARLSAEKLVEKKLLSNVEKPKILMQIDSSPLEELNKLPAILAFVDVHHNMAVEAEKRRSLEPEPDDLDHSKHTLH